MPLRLGLIAEEGLRQSPPCATGVEREVTCRTSADDHPARRRRLGGATPATCNLPACAALPSLHRAPFQAGDHLDGHPHPHRRAGLSTLTPLEQLCKKSLTSEFHAPQDSCLQLPFYNAACLVALGIAAVLLDRKHRQEKWRQQKRLESQIAAGDAVPPSDQIMVSHGSGDDDMHPLQRPIRPSNSFQRGLDAMLDDKEVNLMLCSFLA